MTEAEWFACDDPRKMLAGIRSLASDRKLRLFTVAFWRWESLATAFAESYQTKLSNALRYVETWAESGKRPEVTFPDGFGWHPLLAQYAFDAANWTIRDKRRFITANPDKATDQQTLLLRDIFGNPFRPVTIDPSWLTSDVMALARDIYDERAFDRMPILADALQDAGCTNEDVLNHCRDPKQVHVRGCWVLDLLLGKA
jgi:hypothetical protein